MSARAPSATGEVFGGSARVFAAEAIALPTALVAAGFLTRRLGPGDYGVFTLTTALVAWLEWTLTSLFARASVKLVADADDWRPAGAVVLRLFGAAGLLGLVALWVAAPLLAALMHEPSLARHLRLFALDVPLFMLSQAHQQVLVGTGAYARRATVAAWRWTSRMVLVVAFVAGGFSVDGAIVGVLGASVVELIVARVASFGRRCGLQAMPTPGRCGRTGCRCSAPRSRCDCSTSSTCSRSRRSAAARRSPACTAPRRT